MASEDGCLYTKVLVGGLRSGRDQAGGGIIVPSGSRADACAAFTCIRPRSALKACPVAWGRVSNVFIVFAGVGIRRVQRYTW